MKKTNFYFLLLFIFPFYLNAQLTINDMKMILKMDLDKFETFALKRGYAFNKIIDDNNIYGLIFKKGHGRETRYMSLYSKYFEYGKATVYQITNKSEYLNLKKQIEENGFKLLNIENYDGSLFKYYTNNVYEITLVSANKNGIEIFEITLKYN